THEELACWLPDVADAVKLARAAVAVVGGLVVVKRGAEGAAWATADDQGTVATVAVCGNSVGAGDGFNARLVDGLARGEPPARAVAGAVEMATRIVQAGKGALGVFPPEKGDQT
ncbi:MAG: hypothetical protein HN404_27535, partial [Gemmatimonadetes bacterium]|nr:hypothetical protein [Gemmatimonadota bacterium]